MLTVILLPACAAQSVGRDSCATHLNAAEISLQRASGKYSVRTKSHKDGREEAIAGPLELPADIYNGLVVTVVKNPR
jgi:hypothetical protein